MTEEDFIKVANEVREVFIRNNVTTNEGVSVCVLLIGHTLEVLGRYKNVDPKFYVDFYGEAKSLIERYAVQ